MYFSGKVTHSVLNFINSAGFETERLFDLTDIPSEFLCDPACWLEADKVEAFLAAIEKEYCSEFPGENLIEIVGHKASELKAWGALDSVLKMMQKPQDIFTQPQRFLSYFVSPPPPIGNLVRDEGFIEFDLPISTSEFPYVSEYLRATLESLPTFMNSEMASVTWRETHLSVRWGKNQGELFAQNTEGHNVDPEFMQKLVAALENAEVELEKKNRELYERDRQISDLQIQSENMRSTLVGTRYIQPVPNAGLNNLIVEEVHEQMSLLQSDVLRLNDYLARCQQLVTLLIGQDKLNPQAKEAMRRMDWQFLKNEYPSIVRSACDSIERIKNKTNALKSSEGNAIHPGEKAETNLSEVLESAIKQSLDGGATSKPIQVDKLLFFDRKLPVFRQEFEGALRGVLETCSESIPSTGGGIRIITRPKGRRAEIEISDTGLGIDVDEFFKSSKGSRAKSVIQSHKGHINISSRKGEGSTFLIDIPVQ